MLDGLRALSSRLRALDKVIRQIGTPQVQQQAPKLEARDIVDSYFRTVRDQVLIGGVAPESLQNMDANMHSLLELSHRSTTVQVYRTNIKSSLQLLVDLEKLALSAGSEEPIQSSLDGIDKLIISTLSNMLPSAAKSYEQALRDLSGSDRLSWRGPATDLREALRETLDHLAPDKDVTAQSGFKLEKETNRPTMKQKVRYLLKQRGYSRSQYESSASAADAVDAIVGTFVRSVYTRSSVSTHTPTDRTEVIRIKEWVRVALCEILALHVGG